MKLIRPSLVAASILATLLVPAAPAFAQKTEHAAMTHPAAAAKVSETGNAGAIAKQFPAKFS